MAIQWELEMAEMMGEGKLLLDAENREKLSKDYYWYSPVLDELLRDKTAEAVVVPEDEAEIRKVLALAYRHRVPVTVRGAGTGNYGQAVPLQGGIVIDLSRMTKVLETGEGYAVVQCGVKIKALENHLRKLGHELCLYPTTFAKATIGGFISGGSGGIGSITWGNLWDGNVLEAVILTMEQSPRRLTVTGDEVLGYIHNYGTTGILVEARIRTAPKTDWMQTIVQFADMESAMRFGEQLSMDGTIRKRVVSISENPLPAYFTPFAKHVEPGMSVALLETDVWSENGLRRYVENYGGSIVHTISPELYHKTLGLSDFTWNHTTLWTMKSESGTTYLQASFKQDRYIEQMRSVKAKFPEEVVFHFEWMLNAGVLTPTALPIIRYRSKTRLYEMIEFFESIDAIVYDPHTFVLDYGGRSEYERMIGLKRTNDPLGLLNPGKIKLRNAAQV